jgi:putative hemolysin
LPELPGEAADTFETVGGFVLDRLGRIPRVSEAFEWSGWRCEVVDMDRHRVDKVLVLRVAPVAPAAVPAQPS